MIIFMYKIFSFYNTEMSSAPNIEKTAKLDSFQSKALVNKQKIQWNVIYCICWQLGTKYNESTGK